MSFSQLLTSQLNIHVWHIVVGLPLLYALPINAAQLSGQFNVTVNLLNSGSPNTNAPKSGFCRSTNAPGSFGATVTVVCATEAVVDISPNKNADSFLPTHGGAYRYMIQANRGSELLDIIDSYVGVGSIASWRVIKLADREYLEMLVDW